LPDAAYYHSPFNIIILHFSKNINDFSVVPQKLQRLFESFSKNFIDFLQFQAKTSMTFCDLADIPIYFPTEIIIKLPCTQKIRENDSP